MSEVVKINLMGRDWEIPPMPIYCLRPGWEYVTRLSAIPASDDPQDTFARVEASLGILASAMLLLDGAPTLDQLIRSVTQPQFVEVSNAAADILRISGFVKKDTPSGEAEATT